MDHNMRKTGYIAMLGIFTALAFILGFIESLIPPFTGIPGVKAGFANIVTMVALYLFPCSNDPKKRKKTGNASFSEHIPENSQYSVSVSSLLSALGISTVRILLGGITYNGMSAAVYGLTGAFFSLTVMFLLARTRLFSPTAVSVAGGVAHNIAQLVLAILALSDAVLYYLPMLIVSGIAAGLVIGIIAAVLIRRLLTLTPLSSWLR